MPDPDEQPDEAVPTMNDLVRARLAERRPTFQPGDDASQMMNDFLRRRRFDSTPPEDDAA